MDAQVKLGQGAPFRINQGRNWLKQEIQGSSSWLSLVCILWSRKRKQQLWPQDKFNFKVQTRQKEQTYGEQALVWNEDSMAIMIASCDSLWLTYYCLFCLDYAFLSCSIRLFPDDYVKLRFWLLLCQKCRILECFLLSPCFEIKSVTSAIVFPVLDKNWALLSLLLMQHATFSSCFKILFGSIMFDDKSIDLNYIENCIVN